MLDLFLPRLLIAASYVAVTHLNIVVREIACRYMCLVVQLLRHHSVQHPVQAQALKFRALFPLPVPLPRSKSIFVANIRLKTRQPLSSSSLNFMVLTFLQAKYIFNEHIDKYSNLQLHHKHSLWYAHRLVSRRLLGRWCEWTHPLLPATRPNPNKHK